MTPPALAGDLVLGARVFSNTCATCHSGGQNILEADKTLEKEALEQYLAGGFSEASIVKQVGGGVGGEEGGTFGGGVLRGGGAGGEGEWRRRPLSSSPSPSSASASSGPSRAAAERLTFYPVLTARNRPRAWLPKLGLGGGAEGAGGAGASAARAKAKAKTVEDSLVFGRAPSSVSPSPRSASSSSSSFSSSLFAEC